jgi:hypothetical protein
MAIMGTITVDCRPGSTLRTAMDVLDLARDVLDLVPEWNEQERAELKRRMETLADTATASLRATHS